MQPYLNRTIHGVKTIRLVLDIMFKAASFKQPNQHLVGSMLWYHVVKTRKLAGFQNDALFINTLTMLE